METKRSFQTERSEKAGHPLCKIIFSKYDAKCNSTKKFKHLCLPSRKTNPGAEFPVIVNEGATMPTKESALIASHNLVSAEGGVVPVKLWILS